ncbi:PAS domain S-box protein [candidate division GN15 bacterium]|nr:PAS domain S-box protein [candidate division GN15 bacterium]
MASAHRGSSGSGPESNTIQQEASTISDIDCSQLSIPEELQAQWQQTVDLLARVSNAPLVMLSAHNGNSEPKLIIRNTGCRKKLCKITESSDSSSSFCQTVTREQRELHLSDASSHPDFGNSPLVKEGLVSYFGAPVCWPTGQLFGAICVLSDRPHAFPIQMQRVVQQFRRMFEEDLEGLAREAGIPHLDQPLRERDRLFRSMTELSPDAIFVTDGERIMLTNAAGVKLLRAESAEQVVGLSILDIIPSDQRRRFSYYLQQLLEHEATTVDFDERTMRAVDGTIVPVDAAGSRVLLRGQPAVQIVARDLSWRKRAEERLRQYQRIVSATPDLVALVDHNYVYQMVNDSCQEAWALPEDRMVGHNMAEFFNSDVFQSEMKPRLERCFKGETVRFQHWFEYPGRGRCFMSVTLTPLIDDAGTIAGAVSAARDITDIKEIEDRLRRSEDKFRTVADSAIDWDYWLDPDGNLEYMSPSCQVVSGYSVEHFLRQPSLLDRIVEPTDGTLHSGMDCARLGKQDAVTSEFRIKTADGNTRWVQHTCRPVFADDGRFLGRRATNHDITQRKDAEQALAESEQRFRDLAEQAPVAIMEADRDGRVQYLNKTAYEFFLLTKRDVEDGMMAFDVLAPHERDRARQRFSAFSQGQPGSSTEYVGIRSDGTPMVLLIHSTPMYHNHSFIGLRSIAIDITERKRAEQELERSQATLAHAQKMAHLGSWTHDLISNTVRWSEEMYRILGRDPSTFQPGTDVIWEQMHPEDRPIVEDIIERVIGTHQPQDVEFRIIRPNNSERIVHCRTDVRLDGDGTPIELVGSLLDVTEDKRRERMVRESAAKTRAILDSVDSGFILIDRNGYIQAFNETARQRATAIFGREMIEGVPMMQFVRQVDQDSFRKNLARALEGESITFDRRSYDSDGRPRWHTVRYRPVEDDQGIVIAALFSVTDITNRKEAELSIKRSEDTLRQVVDLIPHDIYAIDHSGRFIMANRTFSSNLGLTTDQVVGQHLTDLFPTADDSADKRTSLDTQIIESGQPRFIPERLDTHPDGRRRWTQVSKVPFDHFGHPAVLTVAVDITERKEAELARRQSEAKIQSILTAAPIGIGMTVNRSVVWASEQLLNILGFTDRDLLGKNAEMLYPTREEYERVGKEKYADIDKYGWGEVTTTWVRKDGEHLDILLRSAPVDHTDLSKGVIFTAMDVTERKRAEDALRYSENRYRELVERMQSGVVVFEVVDGGADFVYKELNKAASAIGRISSEEVVGQRLLENRPDLVNSSIVNALRQVWQTGRPQPLPLTYYSARELHTWIEGHIYRIDSSDLVFIFDDVTDRVTAFEELSKADKLESIGVLAGGIAHDFNNVLTGIVGNVSLLKSIVEDEHEGYSLLDEAEKAAMRARSLTQQLLTFSQGGSPVLTTTSIASVIRECTEFVLHGSTVACEFDLADDLALVEADEGQISQVIGNMVINANQAMTEGGTVHVSAENVDITENQLPALQAGRYVCLSITDTGEGIPPENLPRIFDPFFTTKDVGRGLGLATCYAIVRKHEGHIEVESTPGLGTCFKVYLPASSNDRDQRSASLYNLHSAAGRVLVVDDEEMIRRVATMTLKQIGYRVATAPSGEKAIEMYSEALETGERFDVVLLDLTMPGGIGGKETLERLRETDPDITAIVSSGYSNDPLIADYAQHGFAASIVKPYTFSKLGDVVARVLAARE